MAGILSMLVAAVGALVNMGADKAVVGAAGSASVTLSSNGNWTGTGTTSGSFSSTWISPTGAAGANYDVKAVVVSGTITVGTTGSFLSLGSNQTWTNTLGTVGVMDISIYSAVDHVTPLDTCRVSFN